MVVDLYPVRLAYIVVFAVTALVCFGALGRARARVDDPDTRWGLTTLLALSGAWAAFHVGRLAAPPSTLKLAFYILGLTVGLASVGSWLYFCSAYAGKSYHRQRLFRWLALAVYLSVVGVKLTSPVHGLYFTAVDAVVPFPHLEIQLGVLHWVVTGLAYALSAVGFYILFELFQDSEYATRRLGVLVALAGLPVLFDIVGYASPSVILTMNYEPVGVALFALGVLYVAEGSFLAVRRFGREQLLDELDEAVVLLDDRDIVRDVNAAARELFPSLTGSVGEPVERAAPTVAASLPVDGSTVISIEESDPPEYYFLSAPELSAGQSTIGRVLVFTDITEVERQRRELERQRAQLDDFAEAVTHELRNTLNIVQNHLEVVDYRLDPEQGAVVDSLDAAGRAVDRMTEVVTDLKTLAQFGHTVDKTGPVDVGAVARRAFESAGVDGSLAVDDAGTVQADEARLERLLNNLFVFGARGGATAYTVSQADGDLVVTDDGEPLDDGDVEDAFAYGEAVPDATSGMLLPVVRTLAEAHGWTVTVDTEYREGLRVRITY